MQVNKIERKKSPQLLFGKIVKQSVNLQITKNECEKENLLDQSMRICMNLPRRGSVKPHSNSFKERKRWNHLDLLIDKQKQLHIHEPFDRFIFNILKKGREEFQIKVRRMKSNTIYNNILKELEDKSLINNKKQINTFKPELLINLIKEIYTSNRWYKLYLIKILYKKPLLEKLKELMELNEVLKATRMDYKDDYNKFVAAKSLLMKQPKNKPPFVCGSQNQIKKSEPNIQELNHRQIQNKKLYRKQLLKLTMKVLKFMCELKRQRNAHVELVLKTENKKLLKFFIAAWIHFKNIKKEKKELIILTRTEVNRVKIRNIMSAWKVFKSKRDYEKYILMQSKLKRLNDWFQIWVREKALSERRKMLLKIVEVLSEVKLLSSSFYSWKYCVEYSKQMKKRIHCLISSKNEPLNNRKRIELLYKHKKESIYKEFLKAVNVKLRNEVSRYDIRQSFHTEIKSLEENSISEPSITSRKDYYTSLPYRPNISQAYSRPETVQKAYKAPNQLYKKLRDQLYKEQVPTVSFFAQQASIQYSDNIINRLKEHSSQALTSIRMLLELPISYHKTAANTPISSNNLSITEVIQRSLKGKMLSVFFTKWKVAFLMKWIVADYSLMRYYKYAQRFFIEVTESIQMQSEREEEIEKVYEMKLVYKTLKKWRQKIQDEAKNNNNKAKEFKMRLCFNAWKLYIIRTADKLIKTINAREHYQKRQKFIYMKKLDKITRMNIKERWFKYGVVRKKFYSKWRLTYHKTISIRKFLSLWQSKKLKEYRNQYLNLKRSFNKLREEARKAIARKHRQIMILTADNYIKNKLLSKYYFIWKDRTKIIKAVTVLRHIMFNRVVRSRFLLWKAESEELKKFINDSAMEHNKILLYQCFANWKQESIKSNLAKMFRLRIVMQNWLRTSMKSRFTCPHNYYFKRLKVLSLNGLRNMTNRALKKRNSRGIRKKLNRIYNEKLMKLALVCLLEKVMHSKKYF